MLLVCLSVGASVCCMADVPTAVNRIRAEGCGDAAGADRPLVHRPALDAAAERLAGGEPLTTVTSKSGYHAARSSSIYVGGATEDDLAGILADRYCDVLVDPALLDLGVFQRDDEIWIVLAAPIRAPAPADGGAENVAQGVVTLVNEARGQARRCGRQKLAAAAPLVYSAVLARAALIHARDMAASGRLDHEGSDGSLPADRASRAGYGWSAVAENVAAGPNSAEEAVRIWLDSPGHCANLMSGRYSETGVAHATDPAHGTYWVQVFAAPE